MKSLLIIPALCALCSALPFEIRDPTRETVIEKPDETFKRIDADKNDALNFDEFLHSDLPYEQLKHDEFNQLDADHDGTITRQEYQTHYQKERQNADDLRAEYFGELYEQFDKNFDLKLDISEIEKVLEQRFTLKPRANFQQVFASFDKNGDRGLDLDEYIKFDSELPFHQLDPITPKNEDIDDVGKEEVKPASEFNTPILTMKQEKLPMLKRRFADKY